MNFQLYSDKAFFQFSAWKINIISRSIKRLLLLCFLQYVRSSVLGIFYSLFSIFVTPKNHDAPQTELALLNIDHMRVTERALVTGNCLWKISLLLCQNCYFSCPFLGAWSYFGHLIQFPPLVFWHAKSRTFLLRSIFQMFLFPRT